MGMSKLPSANFTFILLIMICRQLLCYVFKPCLKEIELLTYLIPQFHVILLLVTKMNFEILKNYAVSNYSNNRSTNITRFVYIISVIEIKNSAFQVVYMYTI